MLKNTQIANSNSNSVSSAFDAQNIKSYYKNITVVKSFFTVAGIFINSSFYSEIENLYFSLSNTTAVISNSYTIIITKSTIKDNLSNSPLVILSPLPNDSYAEISETVFLRNKGTSSADVFIQSSNREFSVYIFNTLFSQTIGSSPVSLSVLENSIFNSLVFNNITIKNITSTDCKNYLDLGIMSFVIDFGKILFNNSFFEYNFPYANLQTYPIIYHNSFTSNRIDFINCVIKNNQNDIFLLQNNLFVVQNSYFLNLWYQTNQGYLVNQYNSFVQIENSTFLNNTHDYSLIGIKEKSTFSLSNSLFLSNSGQSFGSLIEIEKAVFVNFTNNQFVNNDYPYSYLLFIQQSNASIFGFFTQNNHFYHGIQVLQSEVNMNHIQTMKDNCIVYLNIENCQVLLENSLFYEVPVAINSQDNDISILNTVFEKINTEVIYSLRNTLILDSITVKNSQGSQIFQSTDIVVNNSSFCDCYTPIEFINSSMIFFKVFLINTQGLVIENSIMAADNFYSNYSDSSLTAKNSLISLKNSGFFFNKNSAIQCINSTCNISLTTFNKNVANIGGAFYLKSSIVNITSSNFTENYAEQGGALFVDNSDLWSKNLIYDNNQAIHGKDIAGIASFFVNNYYNTELVSGHQISNLSLSLSDQFNQIIYTDNSSSISIEALTNNTIIQGPSKILAQKGSFSLDGLIFYTDPGTNASFLIKSSTNPSLQSTLTMHFRKCLPGEIQLSNNYCKVCENNTYSLNTSDLYCKPCPFQAVCYGTSQIYPIAGYWRDHFYPENFYQCLNKYACITGSSDIQTNCAYSYTGLLCASCINGYKLTGSYTCTKCPDY